MSAKVLLLGGGAREHALALKLAQSPSVGHVFVSPGNAGTALSGPSVSNIALNMHDHQSIADWCLANEVHLVLVGPEDPLADGIADSLAARGVGCFGPSVGAARIESSKEFSKDLMTRCSIPTARWKAFKDSKLAQDYILRADFPALVVKASGLAAGKGVVVAKDKEEACRAVADILESKKFGVAGETVIVEELLEGEEVSCLAFCDGSMVVCMPPAQDFKRLLDGDLGPNTGGMGAYCPCNSISTEQLKFVERDVLQKTIDALRNNGTPFVGVLYAGIMLTRDGPRVLEFNCRFGDPETQVILPLLKTDLYEIAVCCIRGDLRSLSVEFDSSLAAVGVVLASGGYPGEFKKGMEIIGKEAVEAVRDVSVLFAGATLDEGGTVRTSGGRVLTVLAVDRDLRAAVIKAQTGAAAMQFEGKTYRTDIGMRAIRSVQPRATYRSAGVDIAAGDSLVDCIKPLAAATVRPGCKPDLGSFGGVFDMRAVGYADPLLVSGTDGVGTKLKIAQLAGLHGTVGIDLVAMCVNDVLCHAAEPLFFLDYFACGRLNVGVARDVIAGVAEGCRQARCALVGGETAEMPDMYAQGEYDLAGFCVGVVEHDQCLPRSADPVQSGDSVIALASSGVHSNGFSLVRRIVERSGLEYSSPCPYDDSRALGESLLTPTKIYIGAVLPAMRAGLVCAAAHITGGGLPGNIERVLPHACAAVIDAGSWDVPPVFGWLSVMGNVEAQEMARTFNCGVGMALVVRKENESAVLDMLASAGENARVIGHIADRKQGEEPVQIRGLALALERSYACKAPKPLHSVVNGTEFCKKVAVLISGSGTNLQSLLDNVRDLGDRSSARITLVISNSAGAFGLKRAEAAGVPTMVINHKDFKSREDFDAALHQALTTAAIDIVCLAGFMRILTGGFVRQWQGRMLNIHPSLLPSFKGAHAHKLVLQAGVRLTGCTVHFVAEEVDSGAILVQEAVPVLHGDTEDTLAERVKVAEHKAFPAALQLVASGKASLGPDGKIIWS